MLVSWLIGAASAALREKLAPTNLHNPVGASLSGRRTVAEGLQSSPNSYRATN